MSHVTFTVEALPPTINLLSRKHWSYRKNQKTLWMELMRSALGINKMRTLRAWCELRHRVRIKVHVNHRRAFDPDNLYSCAKIPLDSLGPRGLGCIVDDSTKWIDLIVEESVGREVHTDISITDLGSVAATSKRTHREPTKRIMGRSMRLT